MVLEMKKPVGVAEGWLKGGSLKNSEDLEEMGSWGRESEDRSFL